MRTLINSSLFVILLVWLSSFAFNCKIVAEDRPNVLIIVSDDQGYFDAGFQGSKQARTPNLDQLAASGVRCSAGYASHPFCSPTRAGLLTGRYQARFGHEFNPVYDPLDENEGLPLSEQALLPQLFETAGYRTGWIGKWHLGASEKHLPWNRGFQETYGFIGGGHQFRNWKPNNFQYTLPLYRNGQKTDEVPEHLTIQFGHEAAGFIENHKSEPWFLYLAFNAPHTPHQPTEAREKEFMSIQQQNRRRYLAQLSLMDDAIGEVLNTLEETGQTKRTLVFFFSDNGGPVQSGANNGKLRGAKGDVYEGGVRVPFIVRWPEKLPSGFDFDKPVISIDIFSTAIAAAKIPPPKDLQLDSVNLLPYLNGENKNSPHEYLAWRNAAKKTVGIRQGEWKLVRNEKSVLELFNLAEDPSEKVDLANSNSEDLNRLTKTLQTWESEMISPRFLGSSIKNEDWGPGGANQKLREQNNAKKNNDKKESKK